MSLVEDSELSLIEWSIKSTSALPVVSQCTATSTSFIIVQVYFMSKNYWCVQRGSFPTVSTGRAGPNQTTAGSEISSSIAPQKADCFPLHLTWLLAASPACMGCCFEPVSCLPKTAFKKLKLAASQSNTFLLLFLACMLAHISQISHSRANIAGYTKLCAFSQANCK